MARAGHALSTHIDSAERLAREAGATVDARTRADRAHSETMDLIQERLDVLEDAVTYERASSPAGAFFQVLVLSGELAQDAGWVVQGRHAAKMVRRLRRLAASIASALEPQVEPDLADLLRSYYLTRRLDDLALFDGMTAAT